MITAGIDAGSRSIKVVLFDSGASKVVACGIEDQGVDQPQRVTALLAQTLGHAGLDRDDVRAMVATGYGRHRVPFAATTITEITCHAQGVHHLAPAARSIIEIGGQDCKVIRLDAGGGVQDFTMNDRCAAGTGRFLEMVAARLGVDLAALGELSRQSQAPAAISNTCVVFAETEIVGLLAEGTAAADIAAGVQRAMAARIVSMAGRALEPPVYFTGGVALQSGMMRALAEAMASPIEVLEGPQYSGALGAALLAARR